MLLGRVLTLLQYRPCLSFVGIIAWLIIVQDISADIKVRLGLSVKSRGLIITCKGAALRLRAYIAVSPQIHCSPSSFISYEHKLQLQIRQPGERQKTCIRVRWQLQPLQQITASVIYS